MDQKSVKKPCQSKETTFKSEMLLKLISAPYNKSD